MAKCEKREVKVEPPPVKYVLTLTEDEAMAVYVALGYFGGYFGGKPDPTESIYVALTVSGVGRKARETFFVDASDEYPTLVRKS